MAFPGVAQPHMQSQAEHEYEGLEVAPQISPSQDNRGYDQNYQPVPPPQPFHPASPSSPGFTKPDVYPPIVEPAIEGRRFDVSRRLCWLVIVALILIIGAAVGGAIGGTLAKQGHSGGQV